MNDLFVDNTGDFTIEGGGLKLASKSEYDANYIRFILQTHRGGCLSRPFVGVDRDLSNRVHITQLDKALKSEIISALSRDGYINSNDLDVKVIFLKTDTIGIIITLYKDYGEDSPLVISFLYYPSLGSFTLPTGDQ